MDSVTLTDVTYTYPGSEGPVLRDINLSIRAGEFCSIIGPNGAGKTTLCAAIRGFVPKFYKGDFEGTVRIKGEDIADASIGEIARDVGFVFQNPFTQMSGITASVYDELAFGLRNLGVPPAQIRERVEGMLELAGITAFRDRDPFQLSGGQQQRVALAAMLIMEQDVIVIDEPTSQLDPQSTDDVFALIEAAQKQGRTIVLVEHKMGHVARYSDRVVLMGEGRIQAIGTPADVFTDPAAASHGITLPESIELAQRLAGHGVTVPGSPLTVPALIGALSGGSHHVAD
ncbi:energy-coupling factor ABC transporter ATP-binding protein [Mycetocola tolaasinivorans]|uniref:energy-coupling factor ABC transporter ATP-binding protein n=1 Tax=Mycetocola tolaasinivorans TaxID=76635 RepID=UPI0016030A25|nr:ABC transporter ATP-binding protein [Mycetocola tolaasinivorans]